MKHFLILISLALFSQLVQAQITPSDTLRPKAKEKQIRISLSNNNNNNNNASLLFKKYTSATFAYRLGLSGGYQSSSNEFNNNNTSQMYYANSSAVNKSKNSSFNIYIDFGIQKSFGSYKNFEPYVGVDLSLGNRFSKQENEITNSNVNTGGGPAIDVLPSPIRIKYKTTSNFSPVVALLPFIGFNYYLAERFALGLEYKLSIASLSISPKNKTTRTNEYAGGYSETFDTYSSKSINFSSSFNGSVHIIATFFIGK